LLSERESLLPPDPKDRVFYLPRAGGFEEVPHPPNGSITDRCSVKGQVSGFLAGDPAVRPPETYEAKEPR